MKTLIVLTGNIGTGKSTWANALKSKDSKNVEIICPDEIFEASGDPEETQKIMLKKIDDHLSSEKTVIIDGNCLTRKSRDFFCGFAKRHNAESIIMDFGPGNEKTLERRISDSKETNPDDWEKIHLKNQREYEKPNCNKEHFDKIIRNYDE